MAVDIQQYNVIQNELEKNKVQLIAVSKTKPVEDIVALYEIGQRAFGENYVQELVDKEASLPKDIQWHFIGHLQSNKVKYIAPFVSLIHGVDAEKLLQEIDKQAFKNNRIIDCLLQVHIASEVTKFGFDEAAIDELILSNRIANYKHIRIRGLMGMASFSEDEQLICSEFSKLKRIYDKLSIQFPNTDFNILSMGMSSDYPLAIAKGSNMVRIGSLLFGARNYTN